MKRTNIVLIVVGIVILLSIGGFAYMYSLGYGQDTFLTVHYYDANQNEIFAGRALSVIGNLEGVEYISLDVNVDNTGEVPLELKIKDASPSQLKSALPTTTLTLAVGESDKWTSSLIDISSFEGSTQIFEVVVSGNYDYAGRTHTLEKTGQISLSIQPDPLGGFDVTVVLEGGSTDEDTDPIDCVESWTCGEWGICTNNEQMRVCTDANNCGTTNDMPDNVISCSDKTVVFRDEGKYNDLFRGWIMYKGVGYGYYGSSGANRDCVTFLGTTPKLDLSSITNLVFEEGEGLYVISNEEIRIAIDSSSGNCDTKTFKTTDSKALDAITTTEPTEPFASEGLEIYA